MKSALFQDHLIPKEHRSIKKPTSSIKRPKSSSPYNYPATGPTPPSTTTNTNANANSNIHSANANGSNGPHWNPDDMVSSYITSGKLPQLLSPSLPPQFPIPKLLIIDTDSEKSHNDSDIDNMPILLLSPTLPTMFAPLGFEKNDPKNDPKNDLRSDLKNDHIIGKSRSDSLPLEKKTVRWINKPSSDKPKFLLRISLGPSEKYTNTFKENPKGLGISEKHPPRQIENERHQQQHHEKHQEKLKQKDIPKNELRLHWLKMAKECHSLFESTKSKDVLFSIVVQFDWFICIAVANHADEMFRMSHGLGVSERHWFQYLEEFSPFVAKIEKYLVSHNIHDKKKAYLSFLVGILSCMKALVIKRINGVITTNIKGFSSEKHPSMETQTKIIAQQNFLIKNHLTMTDLFADAQSFFINCPSPSTVFPKSWHNRRPPINKPGPDLDSILMPASDKYYAPLGPYSDIRDACGYLYWCVGEFCDVYALEINSGNRYILRSGKR